VNVNVNVDVFVAAADNHSRLTPNDAVLAADPKSQHDSSNVELADIESTATEMACEHHRGAAQQTVVRGHHQSAGGGKTKVDVAIMKREERSLQTTIMLITVSTSYVLAYLPVLFHFIVYFIKLKLDRSLDVDDRSTMLIAGNYTKLLYVGGVAVNFFLYTVSGRVFRKQLVEMLGCRRDGRSVISVARRHAAAASDV